MLGTYLLKLCLAKSVIITPLPVDQRYRVSRIRWFMKTVQKNKIKISADQV